jgi:hypothetical protein
MAQPPVRASHSAMASPTHLQSPSGSRRSRAISARGSCWIPGSSTHCMPLSQFRSCIVISRTVGRELRRVRLEAERDQHSLCREARWVPRATSVHVAAGPPCPPGRSAFPRSVGDHDSPCAAFPMGSRLTCALTGTPPHTVCHTVRQRTAVVHQTQARRPVVVPLSDRHGREPLRPAEG